MKKEGRFNESPLFSIVRLYPLTGAAFKPHHESRPEEALDVINEHLPIHPAQSFNISAPDDFDPFNLGGSILFVLMRFSLNQTDPWAPSTIAHHDNAKRRYG